MTDHPTPSAPGARVKLTTAQIHALKKATRRDYPAWEPRVSWFHKATYARLLRDGLVEERFPDIVHLTTAGRTALSEATSHE